MMGNPAELHTMPSKGQHHQHHQHHSHSHPYAPRAQTKATFSGMTLLSAFVALLFAIISAAVPHWGYYGPIGIAYLRSGLSSQDSRGHFGPFQVCKNTARAYTFCGGNTVFNATDWLKVAGACSLALVLTLSGLALFSGLHVAMQLQRKEIMVSFRRAVFLKVVFATISALASVLTVTFGALEFGLHGRTSSLKLTMGVCYYLQIILIFVNVLLIVLCYLSYKKAKSHPPHMVPKHASGGDFGQASYDSRNANGISMTRSSGAPYQHGQPRTPVHPHPPSAPSTVSSYTSSSSPSNINYHFNYQQQQQQYNANANNGNGQHVNFYPQQAVPQQPSHSFSQVATNGFTPVSLVVPPSTMASVMANRAQPLQPLRPIQPVQPIQLPPMGQSQNINGGSNGGSVGVHAGGVSFVPEGRSSTKFAIPSASGAHGGSMESLNSTQSLTLSNLSFGSSTSTGSGAHGPLRSSLKKPKNKDLASVSSKSSSKQVRISLGQEQTTL